MAETNTHTKINAYTKIKMKCNKHSFEFHLEDLSEFAFVQLLGLPYIVIKHTTCFVHLKKEMAILYTFLGLVAVQDKH